jgi:hypothetical protein
MITAIVVMMVEMMMTMLPQKGDVHEIMTFSLSVDSIS